MRKALKVIAWIIGVIVIIAGAGIGYIKFGKPDVGDAPKLAIAATPERIAHGEYLANHVAVCMDCHSTRDWSQFSAPLDRSTLGKGGEKFPREFGFPGNFYSKNITPFGLKDWTDGEIFRTVTTGVTKAGEPLFPIMPYHYYGSADTNDIYDIIAYVRSLKPIESAPPASEPDFPFSLIERTIPHKATPKQRPSPEDSIAYGGYLVNMSGCIECHTKADDKAQLIAGTEFGGGREFPLPSNVARSANITPDNTGIGSWTRDQFITRFKKYLQPGGIAQGLTEKDYNTIMPWTMYAGMTESDLSSIYQYLRTVKPIENQVKHFSEPVKIASR
jgi:mono/diheme cytochrome c family protein